MTKKGTEPMADVMARLLGMREAAPQTSWAQRDALLASLLLASPPPKTTRGVKLADSALRTVSPRATLSPGGTMRKTAAGPGASAPVRRLHPPSC